MSWLPCIRRGGDRWWLPLSRESSDTIAALLLTDGDADSLRAVRQSLRDDPALLVFAAAIGLDSRPPVASIAVAELATDLAAHLPMLLIGDGELGAPPPLTRRDPGRLAKLEGLRKRCQQVPLADRLSLAEDWLISFGPPVPPDWRGRWPRLIDPDSERDESSRDEAFQGVSLSGDAVCYLSNRFNLSQLARTVVRQRELEQRFDTALAEAKRAALKQFAYGLSHEINNPLANISTRAQTLQREEADQARAGSLGRIVDQTMRAHEMVADLMFYAHPPAPEWSAFELTELLDSVVRQTRRSVADRAIELSLTADSQSVTVTADRAMIMEAVRALVRNAVEAIGCDGRIALACRCDRGNEQVIVNVCDSGPGLTEAAAEHAFDPYFSGREAGRGLGVGLCRVERIAAVHGGRVSLSGGPIGCVASLVLPLRR